MALPASGFCVEMGMIMTAKLMMLTLCLGLTACASIDKWNQTVAEKHLAEDKAQAQMQLKNTPQATVPVVPAGTGNSPLYVTPALYDGAAYQATRMAAQKTLPTYLPQAQVTVNHYIQGMMHDLVANLDLVKDGMIIGVTSFVYLDGAYDQADLLGNQLSEGFMHEIHQFGLSVVDFKTTDFIRVTPKGDFVFSRDFMELREEQPIEFVLGGTLVAHQGGTLVNARIVSVASKKVLATAQSFIPQNVANAVLPSATQGKLYLKQGE